MEPSFKLLYRVDFSPFRKPKEKETERSMVSPTYTVACDTYQKHACKVLPASDKSPYSRNVILAVKPAVWIREDLIRNNRLSIF